MRQIGARLDGAVAVEVLGRAFDLGRPRPRALSALMAAQAGRMVPVDHLVARRTDWERSTARVDVAAMSDGDDEDEPDLPAVSRGQA